MEISDIRQRLFRKREYWFNCFSMVSTLLWVDLLLKKRLFCWFAFFRFLRYDSVRSERLFESTNGYVVSPRMQGMWAGVELVGQSEDAGHVGGGGGRAGHVGYRTRAGRHVGGGDFHTNEMGPAVWTICVDFV